MSRGVEFFRRRSISVLLIWSFCSLGGAAYGEENQNWEAPIAQRKREFLVQRIDDWVRAGYPIEWPHDEWKHDEIEPNWSGALAAMHLKRNEEEIARANAYFEKMPLDEKIDPDMRVCEALHAYYLFRDDPDLSSAARRRLLEIVRFRPAPQRINSSIWKFGATENHAFMGHVWCLLTAQIDRDRETVARISQHIDAYIVEHIRKGWLEYNSPCYVEKEVGCLVMVAEWAQESLLRRKAQFGLDALFAEHAALNLEGMLTGPACRVYRTGHEGILDTELNHNSRRDARCSGSYPLMYMLFGQGEPHDYGVLGAPLLATSRYVSPRAVHALATAGADRGCYEFKARRPGRGHRPFRRNPDRAEPGPEVFDARVYAWVTPDFVLGSFQEVNGLFGAARSLPLTSVLRISGSPRRAIYTDLLPGDRHRGMTAAIDCVQYKNVALGRGITGRAYLATREFDEVIETDGWIFVRTDPCFAAYRVAAGGYTWAKVDRPSFFGDFVKFTKPDAPFVLEVAGPADYAGDFERFRNDILNNPIVLNEDGLSYESGTDGEDGPSAEGFVLTLRYGQPPLLDNRPMDLDGYGTLESPYLNSAWDSGALTLRFGCERLTINVRKPRAAVRIEETIQPKTLPYAFDCDVPDDALVPFVNYWRLKPEQWYWSPDGGKTGGCLRHETSLGVEKPERGAHDAAIILRGGERWSDYSFEVDAQAEKGHFGLWIRADMHDEGAGNGRRVQGYYFVLDPAHKKCRLWRARKDGLVPSGHVDDAGRPEVNHFSNPRLLAEAVLPPTVTHGRWVHLRVDVRGDEIRCTVDGQERLRVEDDVYPVGSAGLTTYKGKDVRFDNLRVIRFPL